jgi:ADP-ribose pyrophosphatase YjhB (NUDIX family)
MRSRICGSLIQVRENGLRKGTAMKGKKVPCPNCGHEVFRYENPVPTVDIIIELKRDGEAAGIALIERKNEPPGWSIPGGFVDYGETLEAAAVREAREETGLDVELIRQFHSYSDPARDPRRHTITTVFIARAAGTPRAGDDAAGVGVFQEGALPRPLAFDHEKILEDYFREKHSPQRRGER